MYIGDLIDLNEIVDKLSVNHNYIEVTGIYDQTYSCILCNKYSLNSIKDIKHDDNCVSKRLDHLYKVLDEEIYKMEGEE